MEVLEEYIYSDKNNTYKHISELKNLNKVRDLIIVFQR